MLPIQKLPKQKFMEPFKYGFSAIAVAYKISIVISIVKFIQEDKFKLALPLIVTQLFMIGTSIFSILSNYQSDKLKDNILRELVYLIPQQNKDIQKMEWGNQYSLFSKVNCHFLEAIFLMAIIIFTEKTSFNNQLSQMLNFILLVFLIESFLTKNNESVAKLTLNIVLKFSARSLFLGQFLLCHRSIYFFVFDLIVVLLFISFSGIEELQQNAFTFGYKFDEPKEKLSATFPENLILPPLSFGIHFVRKAKSEDEELEIEKGNLFSGIQVIHILAMILFDYTFNNWEENTIFRRVLHIYLIILSYQFIKSLIWLSKFFMFGPIVRTIIIDCEQLTFLNNNQIQMQYLRFKPLQKIINLKFQNYDKKQFERVVSMLMESKKLFNIYMVSENTGDQFLTLESENIIQLNLKNMEFVHTIVNLIVEKEYYKLPYEIKISEEVTQFQEKFLLNEFVQNYEIIPSLSSSSDVNSNISDLRIIILQSIAFQKHIQNELHFMPQQIFYDIFDN